MRNKKVYMALLIIVLIITALAVLFVNSKEIMISSNVKNAIEKYWEDEVTIREVRDIEVYGKKFRVILSTPIDNEKYKYMNCYEEKLNGLYYRSYQADGQGGSNALFNFSTLFVNKDKKANKENWFTVVYGYNKDLLVDNYKMKIDGYDDNVTSNISHREYFIDTYEGNFEGLVSAAGKDGRDMLRVFLD